MPKRRANGEGNIRKRKDGRWEGRYTAGYDANGKVITKNVLGRTQAEVKDKLRAAIEDSKKLDPVKAGSYTLEQWLKLWYSIYVEPQVRYSTREFYHNAIDHHIIPKLGNVKLEKLTMLQIQQFYNELLKSGRVQKKNQPELKEHGLSPRMVQCVHVVLNKALEYAVEEKLILANPAKKCKIPKNTRKEMKILPEALIGPYLSAAKEHGILAPMYLELTTGLRRGELLALRWGDLDVQNRTLSINKSVARQDGKLVISTPKTPNSIRTVLLPKDTVGSMLEVLTKFRNVCAHNERLFSYNTKNDISDLPLHKKMQIPQNGQQYIYGKHDYFALVLSFRYLLPNKDFLTYKAQLAKLIDKADRENRQLAGTDLLRLMGFPENWKKITAYKKV